MFGAKCFVLKEGNEHLGKFDAKAEEGIFLGYSLESKAYRVYMILDQKVIESLNITFGDTKLASLQRKKDFESLESENLSDNLLDIEEPEIARAIHTIHGNADSGSSGGNGGNNDYDNHTGTPSRTTTQRSESSTHGGNNSGGAGRGSTVNTQHHTEQGETSRSYLPRQRVWNRDHPFELIIGDPDTGVRTRHAT